MNYVLIFKNEHALQNARIDTTQLSRPVTKIPDTKIFLFEDSVPINTVKDEFKEELKNSEITFYVVLHETPQKEFKSIFNDTFGQNLICQNHIRGQFYFAIIPKLVEGSLTFEDIKSFFPDLSLNAKLDLLHKLYGGDFDLSENEKELINQQKFQLSDFENDTNWTNLRKFRDQLFTQ